MPGGENEDLLFSLEGSSIQFVPPSHEQGAAFIANVFGRLTGKAGVCLATLGPGATNLLTGVAAMMSALLFLTGQLEARRRSSVARIATAGAIVSLALAAALQAVDGIALKSMVDAWAAAPASEKKGMFHAAFAVRQLEIGLASMLSFSLGLTMILYGIALLGDETCPKWFAGVAIAGGAHRGCGCRDGTDGVLWTCDGDQYAREPPSAVVDARSRRVPVAPGWSSPLRNCGLTRR